MSSLRNCILLSSFLTTFMLVGQELSFRNYGIEDGLPSEEVFDVFQDQNGFVWFATGNGISRYDGYSFYNYSQKDGLTDNVVFEFFEDHKNRIWLRNSRGSADFILDNEIHVHPNSNQLMDRIKGEVVNSIYMDSGDTLWMGLIRGGGMCKIHGEEILFDDMSGVDYDHYCFLLEDRGYVTGVANRNHNKKERKIRTGSARNGHTIEVAEYTITNHRSSCVRVNDTLYYYALHNQVFAIGPNGLIDSVSFNSKVIRLAYAEGGLWVGLYRAGVCFFKEGDLNSTAKGYLQGSSVSSIMEDNEGGLWIGTLESGAYYVPSTTIKCYFPRGDSGINGVTQLLSKKEGVVLGMDDGSVIWNDGVEYKEILKPGEQMEKGVFLLKEALNGDLLMFTYQGFFLQAKLDGSVSKLANFAVNSIEQENDSLFYMISDRSLMKWSNNVRGPNLTPNRTYGNNRCLLYRNGKYLLGTDRGLQVFDRKKLSPFSVQHFALSGRINYMVEIDGELWVATSSHGVAIIKDKEVRLLTEKQGLPSDNCHLIRQVGSGEVWVATASGVGRINLSDNGNRIMTLSVADGLLSNRVNDIVKVGNSVWLASKKGISIIESVESLKSVLIEQPRIDSVKVNGSEAAISIANSFAYDKNELSIHFSSISFRYGDNIQYKYQLIGAEDHLVYTSARSVRYPGLHPGEYTFKVSASIGNGWSDFTEFTFIIDPPYWQTWWFRLIIVLLAILVIYAFFRLRVLAYNRDVMREILIRVARKLSKPKDYWLIELDKKTIKINPQKVLYISAAKNYVEIFTDDGRYVLRKTMNAISSELPRPDEFIRIHRSYIVRKDRISSYGVNELCVADVTLKVGVTFMEEFEEMKRLIKDL